MSKNFRNITFYLLLIMVAVSLINQYLASNDPVKHLVYSDFLKKLEAGEVQSVTVIGQESIRGKLKDGTEFELAITPADTELMSLIKENVSDYDVQPPPRPPWWTSIVSYGLMFVIFLGFWFFLMQQTQGGNRVMNFGKSKAKLYSQPKKPVTFKDVAGYSEVKEEVSEIVEFLKHPKKFIDMGARIPKGVLLFGPPGTGKTLLARAIAGEAGVPFFSISGSDFVEMFVGVGASRVRDLFDTAKKNAPCIVFIDEIDAVGRQRGAGLGGGHDEREQTLNELLVQMDGFDVNEGLIVIAGTNRPDILDPALLRPGRFDRHIMVGKPDIKDREEILKVHTRGKKLSDEVDLSVLARRTPGFTGADLENLVNEAALLAARRDKKQIEMEELEESINRIIAGPEKKSRVISEQEKQLVAYHEAGHALTGHLLPNTDEVHLVSIIPRGQAGGYTIMLPKEDRQFVTKSQFLDMITHLLGGRAAEELMFGDISTGAQNDLERATQIARKMITEYGMSTNLGPRTFGHREDQVFLGRDLATGRNYSEQVAQAIDNEIKNIINSCYEKAKCILKENKAMLERIAQELMKRETLRREDLKEIFEELEKGDSTCRNRLEAATEAEPENESSE